MKFFEYAQPATLEEAVSLLRAGGGRASLMAGGTDLLVQLKEHVRETAQVVDLKRVPGMDDFRYDPGEGLTLGALVTLRQVETSPVAQQHYASLARAATDFASIQVRHRATIVGNICRASPSADTIPPLIADGAAIETFHPEGGRQITLAEFFAGPGRTLLRPGEIAIAVTVPAPRTGSGRAYLKHGRRKAMELATVGVAVSLETEAGRCTAARVALGAVGPTVLRAPGAEAILVGSRLDEAAVSAAAAQAMQECTPISNVRSSAAYRRDMVGVLTRRAVALALESAA
jgi:CO/xanthine dehydrogenase FAD-binding subunit